MKMRTQEELHTLFVAMADGIARTKKGSVYASRKGIVAAHGHKPVIAIRRTGDMIQLEVWVRMGDNYHTEYYDLPRDLHAEAASILDNL